MNINPSSFSASQAISDSYTDLNALQKIKSIKNQDVALKRIAQQFESMFVGMMLKNMRSANAVFESSAWSNSSEMKMYQDMFDQQLSLTVSQGRGMGIAAAMYGQLKRQYSSGENVTSGSLLTFDDSQRRVNASAIKPAEPSNAGVTIMENVSELNINNFVEKLTAKIRPFAKKHGFDEVALLAQSALETGWGKYMIKTSQGESSFNLFNIKAGSDWGGSKVGVSTLEFVDNTFQKRPSYFRKYVSLDESLHDYFNFIQTNSRYQKALEYRGQGKDYIQALHDAGYATDPEYAEKIFRLYDQIKQQKDSSTTEAAFLEHQVEKVVKENIVRS